MLTIAAVVFAQGFPDLLLPWHPYGSFGFSPRSDGTIVAIVPNMAAAKAGLRLGDRVDFSGLGVHERRRLIYFTIAPAGEQLTFPIVRDGLRRNVTLTATPFPRSLADNVTDVMEVLSRFAFLAIAAALVLLRPSLLTWSFFATAAGSQFGVATFAWTSDAWIQTVITLMNLGEIAAACGAVIFAMLFPRTITPPPVRRAAIGLAAFGCAWFIFNLVNRAAIGFAWLARGSVALAVTVSSLNVQLTIVLYSAAIIAFTINYVRSPSGDRLRMQWVALGFAVGTLGIVTPVTIGGLLGLAPPLWTINVLLALAVFIPISVAYAILHHRVIDVRFFVSRALVYGALTSIAIGLLALLDFAVSRQLEATQLGLAVEVAGAVAIGFGLNKLHGSVESVLDRFVFRSLHDAERRLERVGRAMMYAQSPEAIDAMLSTEAKDALQLVCAHVVRDCDPNHPLVLELQAERAPVQRGDELAMPMLVRHRLLGYVLYGPHNSGAAIDPAEKSVLVQLTSAAVAALDHLAAEARSEENERLRIENGVLRSLIAES